MQDDTLLLPPELEERLNTYLIAWAQSPAASRVTMVETTAQNHGVLPYEDQTIGEFIQLTLRDLVLFLQENPHLLQGVMTQAEASRRVDAFLADEKQKIDAAARVTDELNSYWFGPLDPRYHRARKELKAIINSFKITNASGEFTLPPIHDLKN